MYMCVHIHVCDYLNKQGREPCNNYMHYSIMHLLYIIIISGGTGHPLERVLPFALLKNGVLKLKGVQCVAPYTFQFLPLKIFITPLSSIFYGCVHRYV